MRLIEAWDAIKQLYKFWDSLPKSKRPKCKSYFTLGNALKDNLIVAKLQFFAFVANLVEPFLTKYQTDKPVVPFMYYDIKNIICNILEIIVKPEVLVKIKKPHKLKDIDLSNKNNLIKPGEMSIGFAVDCTVKKLKQKGVINLTNIKVFKKAAQKFIVAKAEELLERTPLTYSLLQSTSVFGPQNLLQIVK